MILAASEFTQILNIDYVQYFLNTLLIIGAIVAVVALIDKFFKIINRPIQWFWMRNKDHELLVELSKKNDQLEKTLIDFVQEVRQSNAEMKEQIQQQYDSNLKYRDISRNERTRLDGRIDIMAKSDENRDGLIAEISSNLKKLTAIFIDKEINDYRWEIINFASNVAANKPCTKDAYIHCFKTYEKYEKVLEENNLENGEVEISMEVVNESYKKKLIEGFDNE